MNSGAHAPTAAPDGATPSARRRARVALVTIVAIGAVLRLILIAKHPLWLDESLALLANWFPLPWREKMWLTEGTLAVAIPGYLLPIDAHVTPLLIRLPAFLAVTAVPLVLAYLVRGHGPAAMVYVAAFGSLGWQGIVLGSEAKGQGILMLCGMGMQWLMLHTDPAQRGRNLGIVACLAVSLLGNSVVALAPLGLAAALLLLQGGRQQRRAGFGWLLVGAAVFAAWLWLFRSSIDAGQAMRRFDAGRWSHVGAQLRWLLGLPWSGTIALFVGLAWLAWRDAAARGYLLWATVNVAGVIAACGAVGFTFAPRYAAVAWPWFALAFGLALARMRRPVLAVSLVVVWSLASLAAAGIYAQRERKAVLSSDVVGLLDDIARVSPDPVFLVEIAAVSAYAQFPNVWYAVQARRTASTIVLAETYPFYNLCRAGAERASRFVPCSVAAAPAPVVPVARLAEPTLWNDRVHAHAMSWRPDVAADAAASLRRVAAGRDVWWIRDQGDADLATSLRSPYSPCIAVGTPCWQGVLGNDETAAAADELRRQLAALGVAVSSDPQSPDVVSRPGMYAIRFRYGVDARHPAVPRLEHLQAILAGRAAAWPETLRAIHDDEWSAYTAATDSLFLSVAAIHWFGGAGGK